MSPWRPWEAQKNDPGRAGEQESRGKTPREMDSHRIVDSVETHGGAGGLVGGGAALALAGVGASPPGSVAGLLAAGLGLALAAAGLDGGDPRARRASRLAGLWGCTLFLALAGLAAQALVQSLPAASRAEGALEVLGLQRMEGPWGYARGFGGRVFTLALAAAHLGCLRAGRARWLTGAEPDGGGQAGAGGRRTLMEVSPPSARRAKLASLLVAATAGTAGCAWPGLMSLPYLLALTTVAVVLALGGFLRSGSAAGRSAWLCAPPSGLLGWSLRACRGYTALHGAALWLWQNPALHEGGRGGGGDGSRSASDLTDALGLFLVGHPAAVGSETFLQLLQGVALAAMVLASHWALQSRRSGTFGRHADQVGSSELEEPILASPGGVQSSGARRLRFTLLLYLGDMLTPVMALGVCFTALVSPIALAVPLLLPAVLHFITREGNRLLEDVSPLATAFSAAWLVASFLCAALRIDSPSLHALGLRTADISLDGRPWERAAVLFLQLLGTAMLGLYGHFCRSVAVQRQSMQTSVLSRWSQYRVHSPSSSGSSSPVKGAGGSPILQFSGRGSPASTVALDFASTLRKWTSGAETDGPSSPGLADKLRSTLPKARSVFVGILYAVSAVGVPCVLFTVGALRLNHDVLHAVYLVLLLVKLLTVHRRLDLAIRVYAGLHVLVLYTVRALSVEPLGVLQPACRHNDSAAKLFGLCGVSIWRDLFPLLLLLFFSTAYARLHASVKKRLSDGDVEGIILTGFGAGRRISRLYTSYIGGYVVILLGFVVVLLDGHPDHSCSGSFLGAVYLALFVYFLLMPPGKTARVHQQRWHWNVLMVLAVVDFTAQYIVGGYSDFIRDKTSVHSDLEIFLRDDVGIDPTVDPHGLHLLLLLLRPSAVLMLLQLYRRLSIGGEHGLWDSRAPEHHLSWTAFAQRVLIVHSWNILVAFSFLTAIISQSFMGLGLLAVVLFSYVQVWTRPQTGWVTARVLEGILAAMVVGSYLSRIDYVAYILKGYDWEMFGLHAHCGELWRHDDLRLLMLALSLACLHRVCIGWWESLPREIHREGDCGSPCYIFWPRPTAPSRIATGALREPEEHGAESPPQEPAARATALQRLWMLVLHWRWDAPADGAAEGGGAQLRLQAEHSWLVLKVTIESFYGRHGQLVTMVALLISSFLSSLSVFSIVYLFFVGLCSLSNARRRRGLWRFIAVPLSASIVLWQYAFSAGLVPGITFGAGESTLFSWLGLRKADGASTPQLMWVHCLAFWFCAMLLQVERSDAELPRLLGSQRPLERGDSDAGLDPEADYWSPILPDAKWTVLELAAYKGLQYSFDFSLVLVVSLAASDQDVMHLGYLILAMVAFRKRQSKVHNVTRLWQPFVAYNYAVLFFIVLYEAYVHVWGSVARDGANRCNLSLVVGVFTSSNKFGTLLLQHTREVLMFTVIQVQLRVFRTDLYSQTILCFNRGEGIVLDSLRDLHAKMQEIKLTEAVTNRKTREVRRRRIEWLKKSMAQAAPVVAGASGETALKEAIEAEGVSPAWTVTPVAQTPFLQKQRTYSDATPENEASSVKESFDRLSPDLGEATPSALAQSQQDAVASSAPWWKRWGSRDILKYLMPEVLTLRLDKDSYFSYALIVLMFLSDFSILSLLYASIVFLYALSKSPGEGFWGFLLRLTEFVLIAQYAMQIPLSGRSPSPSKAIDSASFCDRTHSFLLQPNVRVLGLHGSSVALVPLFLVYLSCLFHTIHLRKVKGVIDMARGYSSPHSGEDPGVPNELSSEDSSGSGDRVPVTGRGASTWYNFKSRSLQFFDFRLKDSENAPYYLHFIVRGHYEITTASSADRKFLERGLLDVVRAAFGDWDRCDGQKTNYCVDVMNVELENLENTQWGDEEATIVTVQIFIKKPDHAKGMQCHPRLVSCLAERVNCSIDSSLEPSDGFSFDTGLFSAGPEDQEEGKRKLRVLKAEPGATNKQDFYVRIFMLDFLCLIFLAIFYPVAITPAEAVQDDSWSMASSIPREYILTLLCSFILLCIDRTIYITRSNAAKLFYHAAIFVIFMGYSMKLFWQGRLEPALGDLEGADTSNQGDALVGGSTEATVKVTYLRVFMLLRLAGLLVSGLQTRRGFPKALGDNYFMQTETRAMWIAFMIYKAIPFLYELRTMLDWTCTRTTLGLFDWMKLEEIRASLYNISVKNIGLAKRTTGEPQTMWIKFFSGTLLFSVLTLVIWTPLLLFSSGNPSYINTRAQEVSSEISLLVGNPSRPEQTYTLFAGGSRSRIVDGVDSWGDFSSDVAVQCVDVAPSSDAMWSLSVPARNDLARALNDTAREVSVRVAWDIDRSDPAAAPLCSGSQVAPLARSSRSALAALAGGYCGDGASGMVPCNASVPLEVEGQGKGLYSLIWRLKGSQCVMGHIDSFPWHQAPQVQCAARLGTEAADEGGEGLSRRGWPTSSWWEVQCGVSGGERARRKAQKRESCWEGNLGGPPAKLVLDQVQGGFIGSFVASRGLAWLYAVFVLGVARITRELTSDLRFKIPYEELPVTKRLTALCEDVYAARAEGELALEEELYWIIIRIYRLPQVLYDMTKKNQ